MILVAALAVIVALFAVGVAAVAAGVARSTVREHARERQLLVNQILHLSGRTWTPPPAGTVEREERKPRDTVASPEQQPDGWDGD